MISNHRPTDKGTYVMPSSHNPDRLDVAFDDDRLVADAGLLLPATLAGHLGLRQLVDEHLDLGRAAGRESVGDKLLTLILSALAGGECIDDANALRTGTQRILGFTVKAASTLGTFLRSFRWATSASSTGSAASSWPGPGRPAPVRAASPSRSISTRRSARRTAWPRSEVLVSPTPASAAIIRSWRSRPGPATCSWRGCGAATPTAAGAPATSCARRSAASPPPARRASSSSEPTVVSTRLRSSELPSSLEPRVWVRRRRQLG